MQHLDQYNANATYHDGTDKGVRVLRGKSGRLYLDESARQSDCETDALRPTSDPQTYRHPHTGVLVTLD